MMVITYPKIWYVCDKCHEWFHYEKDVPEKCPECKKGNLVKTCSYCGEDFEKCKCSKN